MWPEKRKTFVGQRIILLMPEKGLLFGHCHFKKGLKMSACNPLTAHCHHCEIMPASSSSSSPSASSSWYWPASQGPRVDWQCAAGKQLLDLIIGILNSPSSSLSSSSAPSSLLPYHHCYHHNHPHRHLIGKNEKNTKRGPPSSYSSDGHCHNSHHCHKWGRCSGFCNKVFSFKFVGNSFKV